MTVDVYSKPSCSQCMATYRTLDKKGILFNKTDISEDENAFNMVKDRGFVAAPVVIVRDHEGNEVDSWSGFNPGKIASLAA